MKKMSLVVFFMFYPILVFSQVLDFGGPNKKIRRATTNTEELRIRNEERQILLNELNQSLQELKSLMNNALNKLTQEERKGMAASIEEKEKSISKVQEESMEMLAGSVADAPPEKSISAEALTTGSLEHFFSGKLNGSTRLLSLYVGRRDSFWIPLYVYLGTIGDGLGDKHIKNESAYDSLLNPAGGLMNISISKSRDFGKERKSYFGIDYSIQVGFKLAMAQDLSTDESFIIPNFFGNLGIILTLDLKASDSNNFGYLWIQPKVVGSFSNKDNITKAFGMDDRSTFWGYSIEFGAYLADKVNIRGGYYKYIYNEDVLPLLKYEYLQKGVFKIGLEYNLK